MSGSNSDAGSHWLKTERARKGGLAVKTKYGIEHFSRIGRLGGRPTWREALAKAKAKETSVRR